MAIFSRVRIMFLTKDPKTMNLRLSINEKTVTEGQNSETESKTPLMYIRKRIGKAENLCGIPASISLSSF